MQTAPERSLSGAAHLVADGSPPEPLRFNTWHRSRLSRAKQRPWRTRGSSFQGLQTRAATTSSLVVGRRRKFPAPLSCGRWVSNPASRHHPKGRAGSTGCGVSCKRVPSGELVRSSFRDLNPGNCPLPQDVFRYRIQLTTLDRQAGALLV